MDKEITVLQSLEVIERRISEKLTVEKIANAVYFSKYYYQRLFREIVGDSVMDYVPRRKMSLAGRALLESDASIIDIAVEYGYESREGFARCFKTFMCGADLSVFKEISKMAHELVIDLNEKAESLGKQGGSLKVITIEHKCLVDRASQCIRDIEALGDK